MARRGRSSTVRPLQRRRGCSSRPSVESQAGGRVGLEGQGWEVAGLTASTVRLTVEGPLRTVSVVDMIHRFSVGRSSVGRSSVGKVLNVCLS